MHMYIWRCEKARKFHSLIHVCMYTTDACNFIFTHQQLRKDQLLDWFQTETCKIKFQSSSSSSLFLSNVWFDILRFAEQAVVLPPKKIIIIVAFCNSQYTVEGNALFMLWVTVPKTNIFQWPEVVPSKYRMDDILACLHEQIHHNNLLS